MAKLLNFLTGGFNGGTDVDKPLELSLKRLAEKEWNQVGCCMMCHWSGGFCQNVMQLGECYTVSMHGQYSAFCSSCLSVTGVLLLCNGKLRPFAKASCVVTRLVSHMTACPASDC